MEFSRGRSEVRECDEKDEKTEDELIREEEKKLFEGLKGWLEENKQEARESEELNQDSEQKDLEDKEKNREITERKFNEQQIELPAKEGTLDFEKLSEKVKIEEITVKDLEQIQELAKEQYIEQMEREKSLLKQIKEERDKFATERAIELNLLQTEKEELTRIKDNRSEVNKEIEEELERLNEDEHALEKIEEKREKIAWEWADQVHFLNKARDEVEHFVQERREQLEGRDGHIEMLELEKQEIERIKQELEAKLEEKESFLARLEKEREETLQIQSELDTLAKENKEGKMIARLLSQTQKESKAIRQKEIEWGMEAKQTLDDILKEVSAEAKFRELMEDYSKETNKKADPGLKVTKKFKKWIKNNPSFNEFEKHELLEYCNEYEKQLPKLKLEELQEWVDLPHPDSKIISTHYRNVRTKVKVQCGEGHTFEMTPKSIKEGHWCADCSEGVSERIARKFFERIFDKKFPKSRPVWLVNDRGNRMELDGYNEELGIAFEYQGKQHYKYSKYFHKSVKDFKQRQADDKAKQESCKKKGISLIEVPYTIDYDKLQDFIIKKCSEKNLTVPLIKEKIDYRKFDVFISNSKRQLTILREIVKAQHPDGKITSTEYTNHKIKLEFQCEEGHYFKMSPINLKRGHWCPTCAGNEKLTLEDLEDFVKFKHPGAKILSTEYINSKSKIKVRCSKGHTFEMIPNNIRSGRWCRKCYDRKTALRKMDTPEDRQRKLEKLEEVVEEMHPGSKIISTEYVNALTKISIQCDKGHDFEMTPANIKSGYWCRTCAAEKSRLKPLEKQRRFEQLVDLIKRLHPGSRILSTEYVNARTKVLVRCKRGHQFYTLPSTIKRGHWCAKCARKKVR